ncbi:hypothetical protein VTK26DRAFT_4496 [Humicola hyalothermophila]
MHQLVQLVTRKWLVKKGRMRYFAGQALLVVPYCYPFGRYENWAWKNAERFQLEAVKRREEVLGYDHPDTLTGVGNLASTYRNRGRWEEAEALQAKEIELCSKKLGQRHPDTLISMKNLAFVWKDMGRYEDALGLLQGCFALRQQVLGTGHPDTESTLPTLKASLEEDKQAPV